MRIEADNLGLSWMVMSSILTKASTSKRELMRMQRGNGDTTKEERHRTIVEMKADLMKLIASTVMSNTGGR